MPKSDLLRALTELDAAVKAGDATVSKTLRKRATAASLAKLEKIAGKLTVELRTWFTWHDGQNGPSSIGPSANHQLIGVAESMKAWTFLQEEGNRPWKSTWLPIMENGAGDYVVCDRADGKLLVYYHDDKKRPKLATSLAAWARAVAEEWRHVLDSRKPDAPAGWTRIEIPTTNALAKMPTGTALHYRAGSTYGKGVYTNLAWKEGRNRWWVGEHQRDLDGCWLSIANNQQDFLARRDPWVAYFISEERVYGDGEDAAHAGVFTTHFATRPNSKRR